MTEKEFHRNALIVISVIIVAVLLWFFAHKQALANQTPAAAVPPAANNYFAFNVPGNNYSYGPVNFPSSTLNFPGLDNPNALDNTPNGVGSMMPANCSCGCNGSGGSTTYVLQPPDFGNVLNQLLKTETAAAQAIIDSSYASLGYSEGVFVANASPTAFSGGLFPGY